MLATSGVVRLAAGCGDEVTNPIEPSRHTVSIRGTVVFMRRVLLAFALGVCIAACDSTSSPTPTSPSTTTTLSTLPPISGLEAGDYTLTLTIDLATASNHPGIPQAPCAGLPVHLASRSHRVTIVQRELSPPELYNRYVRLEGDRFGLFGFSVTGSFVGFEWDQSLTEEFPGFRYLMIGGTAPTTEPAIATESSVSIPFFGEFRYCQLKSTRGGYNDCSQVPAEQIIDYHSCNSDHTTMIFTKR